MSRDSFFGLCALFKKESPSLSVKMNKLVHEVNGELFEKLVAKLYPDMEQLKREGLMQMGIVSALYAMAYRARRRLHSMYPEMPKAEMDLLLDALEKGVRQGIDASLAQAEKVQVKA